jgi:DNA mismatch repair ATPase MutS
MSMTCGPFAHFTNAIADAAKSAAEALKKKAKDIPAEVKKVVNVGELEKVLSQSKISDQLKQFKPDDMMKNWFGK